jgi:hypothetical protein
MFATIYLPNFGLQAAIRHQPELERTPVVLLDGAKDKATIVQLNEAAARAGIYNGMTPSQGLARCLSLVIKTRSLPVEKRVEEILLHYASSLSPYIEATGAGVATVQFTDNKNLVPKVTKVIDALARSEIIAQAGIAATPDLSFLAAHLAKPVLQVDDATDFLAPLPIETLLMV